MGVSDLPLNTSTETSLPKQSRRTKKVSRTTNCTLARYPEANRKSRSTSRLDRHRGSGCPLSLCRSNEQTGSNASGLADCSRETPLDWLVWPLPSGASEDRKSARRSVFNARDGRTSAW